VQNVPLNKEKDELSISGNYGSGILWSAESFDFQSSYSITNRIGIMLNGLYSNENGYGHGGCVEGAVGYYKPVYKHKLFKKVEMTGIFEIYGGLGGGFQHHDYGSNYWADISGTKVFMQPSFGLTTDFLDLIFSTRICTASFNLMDNQTMGSDYADDINYLVTNDYNFFEPAITLRAGWKNIKLQLQIQPSINLNHSDDYHISDENKISLGLIIKLLISNHSNK
jgi:hypothetical protein